MQISRKTFFCDIPFNRIQERRNVKEKTQGIRFCISRWFSRFQQSLQNQRLLEYESPCSYGRCKNLQKVFVLWNFLRTHKIQEPSDIPSKDESTMIRFAMKDLSCAIVTV